MEDVFTAGMPAGKVDRPIELHLCQECTRLTLAQCEGTYAKT